VAFAPVRHPVIGSASVASLNRQVLVPDSNVDVVRRWNQDGVVAEQEG
jgi:hypothetical protein